MIVNEVKDQLVKGEEAAPTSDQTTTLQRGVCPTASNVETFSCEKCDDEFIFKEALEEHMRGEHSGRCEPVEYPSVSGCETYLCLKCEDRFISKVSLEEHIKEEHRKKEVRCIICGFKFKSTFVLNEHIHKEHPLPRRVQNFGNFRIHDGEVEFSDSEDDEDKDYEMHRAEETEVSGSDDDEGTEDEEEDDYEMQRHKETEDAEDEEGVEEEAEDEEIGQEKAEGGEMQKMMNRMKKSPQRKTRQLKRMTGIQKLRRMEPRQEDFRVMSATLYSASHIH